MEKLAKFDCPPLSPIRFESVKDVHRNHQREYEQLQERLGSSADTSVSLKDTQGSVNDQYRFYQEMKCYVRDLVECYQEKVSQPQGTSPPPSPLVCDSLLALAERTTMSTYGTLYRKPFLIKYGVLC